MFVTEKGVYPYAYMDPCEIVSESELPAKEDFYSKLNEENIYGQDYERAKQIWKMLNIKNLGE